MATPKLIYGGFSLTKDFGYHCAADVNALLDVLEQYGVNAIDTSMVYADSETLLGETKASSRFIIDTKVAGGGSPDPSTRDTIIAQGKESLRKLGTQQVDILYIHMPERRIPLADYLGGINALYQSGAFKRFGLSNYEPSEVEEVIRVCKANQFVVPTVYQGNYNALSRRPETELLPVLRRHDIAFYAYSPIAGGFLAKTSDELRKRNLAGRWSPDSLYGTMYYALYADKTRFLDALDRWHDIARAEGLAGGAELAYRWAVHNSALDGQRGDAVIIGSRSVEQTREALEWIRKGPLSEAIQAKIEALWEPVKREAHLNCLDVLEKVVGGPGDEGVEERARRLVEKFMLR